MEGHLITLDQPHVLFPDVIRHNAKFYGAKTAVVCGNDRLSWAEFHAESNRYASALRYSGLERGDRVCLLMENSITAYLLLWGTIKAGGVITPLNILMSAESLPAILESADPRFLFFDAANREAVEQLSAQVDASSYSSVCVGGPGDHSTGLDDLLHSGTVQDLDSGISPDDSMTIIYSSGTTGQPKGIEHSHRARHLYSQGCAPLLQINRYTVTFCATPLYTNGAWITMLPTVFMGGTVVLAPKFSAGGFLNTVQSEQITHTFLVPTQLIKILADPAAYDRDKSSLKMLLTGGAPMASSTYSQIAEAFPTTGLYEIYGITEGFVAVALPEDRALGKAGTVGKPVWGADLCILAPDGQVLGPGEQGEIAGWSANLMKGYFKDPQRTEEMIWRGPFNRTYLRSGDIGYMDEDGFLYVSGRVKDMILTGAMNVFPSDIEEVFMQHDCVKEVAVIGIPDPIWGETPLALVILRQASGISEQELVDWANPRLGRHQRVRRVEFRTEFPRAAHDKVLKRALRDPYWAAQERTI
ncbi:MAG: class I adenylate-forming enzyme family protein [Candidatus Nanopelagicales bacterium]